MTANPAHIYHHLRHSQWYFHLPCLWTLTCQSLSIYAFLPPIADVLEYMKLKKLIHYFNFFLNIVKILLNGKREGKRHRMERLQKKFIDKIERRREMSVSKLNGNNNLGLCIAI